MKRRRKRVLSVICIRKRKDNYPPMHFHLNREKRNQEKEKYIKNEDKKNERGIKGMRYADMPPYAPTLMESTRAIGYSIEAAIADIIDNSVAATAGKIDIDFFPIGHSYISILDDGHGMSEEELIIAMQYGSRSPLDERAENDLGRYGLGMKTASLSQCRILTVISKKDGKVSGAQWNLNHIRQAESWSLIVLEEDEIVGFPNWGKN